ncbi:MAG: U32 family peptidase [Bacteroidales bacterium]|nr:U32 family peptidase [Bacteroidales bacterium]
MRTVDREYFEIMAPVGSYESLMAAIQGGANSVYFGLEHLNMRSRSANNFTIEDLKKIVSICKENNVKTYLTINTVIFDHDIEVMHMLVDAAKENGVSAVIASDISVIQYARSIGVEIHMSTQVNITNIEEVKFWSTFADVMVLAREMSLKQVKEITAAIERESICGPSGKVIEIEMFVHGALCMAVSGKCYLSLHENNASANRGACLQTCRKGYVVTEKETGNQLDIDNEYIMSPKDLCTVNFLNKLLDAGVKVLKIEGRARGPEYVKTVVKTYNEAINAYLNNDFTQDNIDNWMTDLSAVYNRGYWGGYYLGRRLGEWNHIYGSRATKRKVYVGKITNYFKNIGVAEIKMETGEISVGDEILVIGPTTGVYEDTIKEIRVDLKPVETTVKGDLCSMVTSELVRRADKVYKLVTVVEELD